MHKLHVKCTLSDYVMFSSTLETRSDQARSGWLLPTRIVAIFDSAILHNWVADFQLVADSLEHQCTIIRCVHNEWRSSSEVHMQRRRSSSTDLDSPELSTTIWWLLQIDAQPCTAIELPWSMHAAQFAWVSCCSLGAIHSTRRSQRGIITIIKR
jgi:hypothetical protein